MVSLNFFIVAVRFCGGNVFVAATFGVLLCLCISCLFLGAFALR